ncbi:MAG: UbiD family decarboxylase [Methanosarcinales archaeon]|nr:UbiD family decarboxylase [Methanosarcinales archaeon]
MSFRSFIDQLKNDCSLTEIREPVAKEYDATGICGDGTPVLFHDIDESRVAVNILASRDALCSALSVKREGLVAHLASVGMDGETRLVADSQTKEIREKPDLSKLPILTYFKDDPAPYITAGVLITEIDGVTNASIHRMMVIGNDRLAVRLVAPRHTYLMHKKALERGEDLPVAIAIGLDPAVLFALCTRVPEGLEFRYASAIIGEPLEVFECGNGLRVPHCEIVLEGYIGDETAPEGPFVDITGTYDRVRSEPVIRITGISHREDPIYHAIVPSGREHKLLMGVPYEPRIFSAVNGVADAKNVVLTDGGCCYFNSVVQIEKRTEGDPKNAILAAFAAHPSLKNVVVVDPDINIYDPSDVEFAIATRVLGDRDLLVVTNVRGSSLDPISAPDGTTTKVGVDATMPIGREGEFIRVLRFDASSVSVDARPPPRR